MKRPTTPSRVCMIAHSERGTSFRRAQLRILLAVMFCYLFFYTGRQTFGFAIPGIQEEFGVSKTTLGWVSAGLLWCYAIGQAINGNVADALGGRRVMTAGAILSCVTNWAVSFSTSVASLGALWGLNGFFQSMGWAPGSKVLSNWFGSHERGMAFGAYVFAAGMASVLSFITSLVIVELLQLDWRWIFRLPVLLMLLGGVVFYFVARDRPEDLGFSSPHGDATDRATAAKAELEPYTEQESWQTRYLAVISNWRLMLAGLAIGFQNAARYGLLIWVPVHYLTSSSATGSGGGAPSQWISIALPLGMAFGAATNGWLSDNVFGSRRYVPIALYMLLAAGSALIMYVLPAEAFYLSIVMLFLCGFFVYGPQSSFWALCPDLVGYKRAGTAIGAGPVHPPVN